MKMPRKQQLRMCPGCHCLHSVMSAFCSNCTRKKSNAVICPSCTFSNDQCAETCTMCSFALRVRKDIPCLLCKRDNDPTNEYCPYCEHPLKVEEDAKCPICDAVLCFVEQESHIADCRKSQEMLEAMRREEEERVESQKTSQALAKLMQEEEKKRVEYKLAEEKRRLLNREKEEKRLAELNRPKEFCELCGKVMEEHLKEKHAKECSMKGERYMFGETIARMTPLQVHAMDFMYAASKKEHQAARKGFIAKFLKFGFTMEDLSNLHYYIENYAPIIVHVHISKHMEFFVKDTHYRCQFETNKSSGSLSRTSRTQWEDRMFTNNYSKATDFERVKYGVINFTNDPKGVSSCLSYGQSYFLLKEHVRARCTFTDKDSSNADASIATFKFCFKILSKLTDEEIKAAVAAARANEVASNCTRTYKEIQIHGPLEFAKDIDCLYVNRKQVKDSKKHLEMVYEFCEKNKIRYDFF